MRRTLAKEALYNSSSFDLHHIEPAAIPAMESLTSERIQEIDPGGKKALALLRELTEDSPRKQKRALKK